MKQFIVTPACGKRLIGKAMATHPAIVDTLQSGTIVITAGTTNGYVAEEVLSVINQADDFKRNRFFRGITLPPGRPTTKTGRMPDENKFPGDVIIVNGVWQKGKTIFDVVDDLKKGDVILKGANAIDLQRKQAAVLIGDTKAGTIGAAIQAVIGRRVQLILPAGLEKRVSKDLNILAEKLNHPKAQGPRLFPVPGQIFTEIDAIRHLTGADAELVASGGVCGAEGSLWLAISGDSEQMETAKTLMESVLKEPGFEL